MSDYKKFIYVSNGAGIIDGTAYATEADKFAYILSQSNTAEKKWYKSIIFRTATNEIYNRGKAYGLSVADATRITNLETAKDALVKAQLATKSGENVITIEDGTGDDEGKKFIYSTLSLGYDDTEKKLQLKGINNAVVADLDAKKFIKDGMVESASLVTEAEEGVTEEVPYIKLVFNSDVDGQPTHDTIRFSVKSLVDVYTAANVKLTNAYSVPETYTSANIKTDATLETVVGELVAGIKDAKDNGGVTSIGGKSGAITLEGELTENGTINLTIDDDKKITATINGLGSAAYTDADAYATAEQGTTADSAIQSLTIAGTTLTKESGTLTASAIQTALMNVAVNLADVTDSNDGLAKASDVKAEITKNEKTIATALNEHKEAIDEINDAIEGITGDYVKKADTLSANTSDLSNSVFTKVTLGGTKGTPTVSVSNKVVALADATSTNKGLVEASDVKKVIEDNELVTAAAISELEEYAKSIKDENDWEEL